MLNLKDEYYASDVYDHVFDLAMKYSERFDPVSFLSLLPALTPTTFLMQYFKVVMETLNNQRHNLQVCEVSRFNFFFYIVGR